MRQEAGGEEPAIDLLMRVVRTLSGPAYRHTMKGKNRMPGSCIVGR